MSELSQQSAPATPRQRRRKWVVLALVLLMGGAGLFYLLSDFTFFPHHHASTVLVLDDCDDDYRNPPFEDAVIALGPRGKSSRPITNLNICQTIGGGRMMAVSPDGAFFVVCENVGNRLMAYSATNGARLWEQREEFTAATIAADGTVYGVVSAGTIYGKYTVAFSAGGELLRSNSVSGFDVALDEARSAIWLVGNKIQKCDLSLNVVTQLNVIGWCASSVDV